MQRYLTIALLLLNFSTSHAMNESKETANKLDQEKEVLFISHTTIATILKQNRLNLSKVWRNTFARKKAKEFDSKHYIKFSHNLQENIKYKFDLLADRFNNDDDANNVALENFNDKTLDEWYLFSKESFDTDTQNLAQLSPFFLQHTSKQVLCYEDDKIYLCDLLQAIGTLSAEYFTITSIENRLKNAFKQNVPLTHKILRRLPMIYITIEKNDRGLKLKAYPYAPQHKLTYTPLDDYDNPYPLLPYTWKQKAAQYALGALALVGIGVAGLLFHWFFTGFIGRIKNYSEHTHPEQIKQEATELKCAHTIEFTHGYKPMGYDLVEFNDTGETGICTSSIDCFRTNNQDCTISWHPPKHCRVNYKLCSQES